MGETPIPQLPQVPEGWYRDPTAPGVQRWWDGTQWTGAVRADPARQTSADDAPKTTGQKLTVTGIVAAACIVLGSFLPWATVSGLVSGSVNGIDGDGVLTMVIGVILGVLCLTQYSRRDGWRTAVAAAVIVGAVSAIAIAGAAIANVKGVADEAGPLASVSPGVGLYVVLLAAIGIGVVSLVSITSNRGTS